MLPKWSYQSQMWSCVGWLFMFGGRNTRLKYMNTMVTDLQQIRAMTSIDLKLKQIQHLFKSMTDLTD